MAEASGSGGASSSRAHTYKRGGGGDDGKDGRNPGRKINPLEMFRSGGGTSRECFLCAPYPCCCDRKGKKGNPQKAAPPALPYRCEGCDRWFSSAVHYKEHLRQHKTGQASGGNCHPVEGQHGEGGRGTVGTTSGEAIVPKVERPQSEASFSGEDDVFFNEAAGLLASQPASNVKEEKDYDSEETYWSGEEGIQEEIGIAGAVKVKEEGGNMQNIKEEEGEEMEEDDNDDPGVGAVGEVKMEGSEGVGGNRDAGVASEGAWYSRQPEPASTVQLQGGMGFNRRKPKCSCLKCKMGLGGQHHQAVERSRKYNFNFVNLIGRHKPH